MFIKGVVAFAAALFLLWKKKWQKYIEKGYNNYKKKLKDKKYIDKAIEGLAGDLISFVNYIEIESIKIKKRIKWI